MTLNWSVGGARDALSTTRPLVGKPSGKWQRRNSMAKPKHPFLIAEQFLAEQAFIRFWNGEWYRWTGCAYRKISTDEIKKAIFTYLCTGTRTPPSRSIVNAVLEMLRLATLVQSAPAPLWLVDGSPYPANQLVAVKNGLLHLPSLLKGRSKLLPHTPTLFTLNALGYDYQADATCPQWERFLSELWAADAESIHAIQEWCGYLLLPDTSQQKLLMLIGPTRSGKGTIARVIRAMLGKENVASPTMRTLSGSFGLWGLLGKLLAIVPDASLARASASLVELIRRFPARTPSTSSASAFAPCRA
jgi:putative DNA primase/helicase